MRDFLKIAFIVASSGFFLWLMIYFAWLVIKPDKKSDRKDDTALKPTK